MRPSFTTFGRVLGAAALVAVSVQPALAQRNVTLRMNSATLPDTIVTDAATAGVQLRGGLVSGVTDLPGGNTIAWDDATTLRPSNDGGDYWSVDFQIPDNDELRFKFYFQQAEDDGIGGWEDNGPVDGNFAIPAGTEDVALDLHYFNKTGSVQQYDWRPFAAQGDSIAVWLRVFMDTQDATGRGYDPEDGATEVGARGNFGTLGAVDADGPVVDWGEGGDGDVGVRLTRESTDATRPGFNIFSGLVKYPASSALQEAVYKFYFRDSNNSGDNGYEGADNRVLTLPAAGTDTTVHWVLYGNSPANTGEETVTANTTFQVNVEPLAAAGLFEATADLLQVRGGFNGWDCPDDNQDDCLLDQEPFSTIFSREIPVEAFVDSRQEYKYYLDFDEEYDRDIGWEEPLDNGGSNRSFTFSGNASELDVQQFNDIRAGNVIAEGRTVNVTFQVNMAAAMDYEPRGFDPAVDTVTVQFEDEVWLLTQDLEPGNPALIANGEESFIAGFELTDPDGDMVYTATLPVSGPSYNGIGYKYAFANDADGVLVESGDIGVVDGRRRYRYILGESNNQTFALDVFRPEGTAVIWEGNPTSGIDPAGDRFVNDVAPGTPDPFMPVNAETLPRSVEGGLSLSAAYPNPTGGIARMAVSVDRDEMVIVRVYDVTGRQVAVVSEGFQTAGSRTVEFNASALASGVYLVRAEAGADVVTRRLTVTR